MFGWEYTRDITCRLYLIASTSGRARVDARGDGVTREPLWIGFVSEVSGRRRALDCRLFVCSRFSVASRHRVKCDWDDVT
jgi:hypothetical protein